MELQLARTLAAVALPRCVALVLTLCAAEVWVLRDELGPGGVLHLGGGARVRAVARAVTIVSLFVGVVTVLVPCPAGLRWLLAFTQLQAVAGGGAINGGSDSMLLTLGAGAVLVSLDPGDGRFVAAGMAWIAWQVALSYLRAGVAKARHWREWDAGVCAEFVRTRSIVPMPALTRWLTRGRRDRVVSRAVVVAELGTPVVLLLAAYSDVALAVAAIGAVVFHACIAWVFGLHRFLWAWCTGWIAVAWCAWTVRLAWMG